MNSPANLSATARSATSLTLPPAPEMPETLASGNPVERERGRREFNRRLQEWVTRSNHVLDQAILSLRKSDDSNTTAP